ncbi:Protein of unknown function [Yoonia tamlensis]|uniref:DUF3102 domain-containing protein n=1 Tax=Yoonia tamlensis TaxID=390270 RepID=A0A1I6FTE7_9RHOB|nr:DUF3102 domain-containing protein [Yoonia tamlensis]SFR33201.1 Protein of unknown function [Yoonia tamlensis]
MHFSTNAKKERLGRTAKEIAAEIGEELIKVKASLKHGEFIPWVKEQCSFAQAMAYNYMKIANLKLTTRCKFDQCNSIREVLALGKPKPTPKQERRAATLDDLRKVERLRALRDDPEIISREKFVGWGSVNRRKWQRIVVYQ